MLARCFVGPLLAILAAFVGVHVLVNAIGRFQDVVLGGGASGIKFLMLQIPIGIEQLLPPACLTAVLLAFGLLNRTGEVLAFQGVGISRLQMVVPIAAIAAALSLCDFALGETMVPFAYARAHRLLDVEIRKQVFASFATVGIWIREKDGFLSADRFDDRRMKLEGVTLYEVDPKYGLRGILYAQSADWDGKGWLPSGLRAFRIDRDGMVRAAGAAGFHLEATPGDLRQMIEDPDDLSLADLDRYIDGLRRKGLDPGRYLVDRDLRYAKPVSCLILALLGVALSLDPLPRRSSLARPFAAGIAVGFLYWVVLGISVSLGRSGAIASWLAAWLPNVLFTVVALSIFLFGEERGAA